MIFKNKVPPNAAEEVPVPREALNSSLLPLMSALLILISPPSRDTTAITPVNALLPSWSQMPQLSPLDTIPLNVGMETVTVTLSVPKVLYSCAIENPGSVAVLMLRTSLAMDIVAPVVSDAVQQESNVLELLKSSLVPHPVV